MNIISFLFLTIIKIKYMLLRVPIFSQKTPPPGHSTQRLSGSALAFGLAALVLGWGAATAQTAATAPSVTPAPSTSATATVPAPGANPPEPQAVAPQSFGYAAAPQNNPVPLLGGGKAVREALQKGGYIIYFRHGRTDLDQIGREAGNRAEGKIDLARWATQRNLSDEGRAELKQAGEQFRKAAIPLDKSFSSPYCRTKETAAYFTPRAQPLPVLAGFSQVPAKAGDLAQLFSQRPAAGKNTLIVAHGLTLLGLTGFAVGEGHAVVLEPGNFKTIVARIAPLEWSGVASAR